jgi:hypothetical protein
VARLQTSLWLPQLPGQLCRVRLQVPAARLPALGILACSTLLLQRQHALQRRGVLGAGGNTWQFWQPTAPPPTRQRCCCWAGSCYQLASFCLHTPALFWQGRSCSPGMCQRQRHWQQQQQAVLHRQEHSGARPVQCPTRRCHHRWCFWALTLWGLRAAAPSWRASWLPRSSHGRAQWVSFRGSCMPAVWLCGCLRPPACLPLPLARLGTTAWGYPPCCRYACISHTACPPACIFVAAGNTALSGQYLPVVPYKLLHAYALAELGLVQQAMAYCSSMNSTLQVRRCGCRLARGVCLLA